MDTNQIIETWEIHNRINLYLLDSIKEKHLADISASKGRNVGEQYAHVHNVRIMWLKAASPDLFKGQNKIKKGKITKELLTKELSSSAITITLLQKTGLNRGK